MVESLQIITGNYGKNHVGKRQIASKLESHEHVCLFLVDLIRNDPLWILVPVAINLLMPPPKLDRVFATWPARSTWCCFTQLFTQWPTPKFTSQEFAVHKVRLRCTLTTGSNADTQTVRVFQTNNNDEERPSPFSVEDKTFTLQFSSHHCFLHSHSTGTIFNLSLLR